MTTPDARTKARALYALELLEQHVAAVNAAISALRAVQASRALADVAMRSATDLIADLNAAEMAYALERLGLDEGIAATTDSLAGASVLAVDPAERSEADSRSIPQAVGTTALTSAVASPGDANGE